MKWKFWFINFICAFIIFAYLFITVYELIMGTSVYSDRTFYEATIFQICAIGSLMYLIREGMLVHKTMISKKIKEDDTSLEFGIVDKSHQKNIPLESYIKKMNVK